MRLEDPEVDSHSTWASICSEAYGKLLWGSSFRSQVSSPKFPIVDQGARVLVA